MGITLNSEHKRRIDAIANSRLRAINHGPPKDFRRDGESEASRLDRWTAKQERAIFTEAAAFVVERFGEEWDTSDSVFAQPPWESENACTVWRYINDLCNYGGLAPLDSGWAKNIATERKEDIVKGIFSLGGYGVIAAPSKSGKSWLALELGTAVATQTPFIGAQEFDVPKARDVVVFYPEGVSGLYGRLDHLYRARGYEDGFTSYSDADGRFEPITNRINFSNPQHLDGMSKLLAKINPDLVIYDSAYLAMSGVDGSSQNQLGDVLAGLHERVLDACGGSMWVTTHYKKGLNKAELNSISGAGWDNWPNDWILMERLTSNNDGRLRARLLAYGRDWKGAALDIRTEMLDGQWTSTVGVQVAEASGEDALGRIVRHMIEHVQDNGPATVTEIKGSVKGKTALKSEAWNFVKESGKVRQVGKRWEAVAA